MEEAEQGLISRLGGGARLQEGRGHGTGLFDQIVRVLDIGQKLRRIDLFALLHRIRHSIERVGVGVEGVGDLLAGLFGFRRGSLSRWASASSAS